MFTAYIRPQGISTPLLETIQAESFQECRTMATASLERLSINGALPTGKGFFHIRDYKSAVVFHSNLIGKV